MEGGRSTNMTETNPVRAVGPWLKFNVKNGNAIHQATRSETVPTKRHR
jgi:hypothetical protein